jgi:hypothetical protein
MTLTVSSDVIGVLSPGAAATAFSRARVGQNARYSFNAVRGQNFSLLVSGSTFASTPSVSIYKPDGGLIYSAMYFFGSTLVVPLPYLPMTGNYTVFVYPYGTDSGTVNVQLLADATNALVADGPVLAINLATGQDGAFNFSGTLGQHLGLGVSGLSTNPAGGSITVSTTGPDGVTALVNCLDYTSTNGGGVCTLPTLPASGTYTVRVVNAGFATSANLTLSNDVIATLRVNGATQQFQSTRVGQNVRYNFQAVKDGYYWVTYNNATYDARISVFQEDGTLIGSGVFSAIPGGSHGVYPIGAAASDGTYTVVVGPTSVFTGQIVVGITGDRVAATPTASFPPPSGADVDTPIPDWALALLAAMLGAAMIRSNGTRREIQ